MVPKFMVIVLFGFLLVFSADTIKYFGPSEKYLATYEDYIQVTTLFQHKTPRKKLEKDNFSQAICPEGYKLCTRKKYKDHHCVATKEPEINVQDGSETMNYTECTEPTTVDRDMFRLVLQTDSSQFNDIPEKSDSIQCKIMGNTGENKNPAEVRYFTPKSGSNAQLVAKQTKSWTTVKFSNDYSQIQYEVICGTLDEIEPKNADVEFDDIVDNTLRAEEPKKEDLELFGNTVDNILNAEELRTKNVEFGKTVEKILRTEEPNAENIKFEGPDNSPSSQSNLMYYAVLFVVIIVLGIFVYHAICTNTNESLEDENNDTQLIDILNDTMSKITTQPNNFIISIEDLKKIQQRERENELSKLDCSLSEKSHSNEESSEEVNRKKVTDESESMSEDETSTSTKKKSNSSFSPSGENMSEEPRENELSEINCSLSDKSHSKDELSEEVNQKNKTDESMTMSEDEISKQTEMKNKSLVSLLNKNMSEEPKQVED